MRGKGAGGISAPRPPVACLLLPYGLLLVLCGSVFAVTTDDPFITYRCARNLVDGHGPVFNPGEHVEGFSSPLHLLICVLLLNLCPGVGMLFKAKLLGVLFAILAMAQTGRLARLSGLRPWERWLAQMAVALNVNFALAAVNGLETTLAACVLLYALETFLRECRGRGGVVSALLLGVALLARPETLLVFAGLLAVRGAWAWRRRLPLQTVLAWAVLFVWLAAMLTLARMAYYGDPLPNTYSAKHVPIPRGLTEGMTYLLHPVSPSARISQRSWRADVAWPDRLVLVGSAVFWVTALSGLWARRRRTHAWTLGAVISALIVFVLRSGGDWMAGWRFLAPVLPVFAILQCHGLRALARRGRAPRVWLLATAFAVMAVWAGCAWTAPHASWITSGDAREDRDLLIANGALGRKWVATAEWIHRHPAAGGPVAYSEMGYAGWLCPETTFCDVRGLTDREIARLPDVYKGTFGVDDERWFVPGDPLYRILIRRRPALIIAFSHPGVMPGQVLDGYSRVAAVRDPRDSDAVIVPSLVYETPEAPANEKPLTRSGSGGRK